MADNSSSIDSGSRAAARPIEPAALRALAERCEREEPSRGLDEDIARAAGWQSDTGMVGAWWLAPGADAWVFNVSSFSTSLDAAVTLVPEAYADHWGAHRVGPDCIGTVGNTEGSGRTPALALCAAALRARADAAEGEA